MGLRVTRAQEVVDPQDMWIDYPGAFTDASDLEWMARLLPLQGAQVLELGCGRAWMTRHLACNFGPALVIATEVDRIQHEKNLEITDLPGVRFVFGGAQAIDLPDASVDVVIMLKSLHHVPVELMDQGLAEIARVLKPGGLVYISEPIYRGSFNDILSLFNDEQRVREAAFAAVRRVVLNGSLRLVQQIFFNTTTRFTDFADFESRILRVTHTQHRLDEALYQQVKAAFAAHETPAGASFSNPTRVDLLRRSEF